MVGHAQHLLERRVALRRREHTLRLELPVPWVSLQDETAAGAQNEGPARWEFVVAVDSRSSAPSLLLLPRCCCPAPRRSVVAAAARGSKGCCSNPQQPRPPATLPLAAGFFQLAAAVAYGVGLASSESITAVAAPAQASSAVLPSLANQFSQLTEMRQLQLEFGEQCCPFGIRKCRECFLRCWFSSKNPANQPHTICEL